jgi:hypothetical protein
MIDADIIVEDPDVFLGYMREAKRPIFHNSNIFFRDIQYGVRDYFEDREGKTISSKEAIRIANDLTRSYERMGVLRKVNSNGYLLIYPDMLTPKGGTIEVLTACTCKGSRTSRCKRTEANRSATCSSCNRISDKCTGNRSYAGRSEGSATMA